MFIILVNVKRCVHEYANPQKSKMYKHTYNESNTENVCNVCECGIQNGAANYAAALLTDFFDEILSLDPDIFPLELLMLVREDVRS